MSRPTENEQEHPVIEVYEWKEGMPRPGTTEKAREACIETLQIPPGGILPVAGDVIFLMAGPLERVTSQRYRVIEREMMWLRKDDSQDAPAWSKMWIHVRRLEDETK